MQKRWKILHCWHEDLKTDRLKSLYTRYIFLLRPSSIFIYIFLSHSCLAIPAFKERYRFTVKKPLHTLSTENLTMVTIQTFSSGDTQLLRKQSNSWVSLTVCGSSTLWKSIGQAQVMSLLIFHAKTFLYYSVLLFPVFRVLLGSTTTRYVGLCGRATFLAPTFWPWAHVRP